MTIVKKRIFAMLMVVMIVFTGINIGNGNHVNAYAQEMQGVHFVNGTKAPVYEYPVIDEEGLTFSLKIPDSAFNKKDKAKIVLNVDAGKTICLSKDGKTYSEVNSSTLAFLRTLNLKVGEKFYIKEKTEDALASTYIVKSYATLNELSVSGKSVTPAFSWGEKEYSIAVADKSEQITINVGTKSTEKTRNIKVNGMDVMLLNGEGSITLNLADLSWKEKSVAVPIDVSDTDPAFIGGDSYTLNFNYSPEVKIIAQSDTADREYYDNETKPSVLSVTATAPTEIRYRWFISQNQDLLESQEIEGVTASEYQPQINRLEESESKIYYYYCVAQNSVGDKVYTAQSDVWKVTIKKGPYPSVSLTQEDGSKIPETGYFLNAAEDEQLPTIKANVSLPSGHTAEEANITYKWYQAEDKWNTVLASSQTFTCVAQEDAIKHYYCLVSYKYDNAEFTTKSQNIRIAILGFPKNYLSYSPNQYGYQDKKTKIGKSVKIGVTISCSPQGQLYYQWYGSDDGKKYTPINDLEQSLTSGGFLERNLTLNTPVKSASDESYYYCKVIYQRESKAKPGEIVKTELATVPVKVTTEGLESVSGFEGEGEQGNPYLIKNITDLQRLRKLVNEENISCYEKYFKLETDITIPKADWTPIGTENNFFMGHINGNHKTLTVEKDGKPLLGYVREASVSNLNLFGERIDGYGLVENYVVDYATKNPINITNVTIKEGTKIVKSGFIGGYASGQNQVYITNCKIEKGVTIGCDKDQDNIGGFAGEFNGIVINCVNEGDVYGKNFVGGIIADKGQCMGNCIVRNCTFSGKVVATGDYVGGISGAAYGGTNFGFASAPNTPCITIQNCISNGEISGNNYVGGILGAEPGVVQCWDTVKACITDNLFVGKIKATGSNPYIGGIVGYFNSINNRNEISNNYFVGTCGTKKGIGRISMIDTDAKTVDKSDVTVKYINTSGYASYSDMKVAMKAMGLTGVEEMNHNRSDDPLGADADKLCKMVTETELGNGTVMELLNASTTSFKNWEQGENSPTHSKTPVLYAIELSGTYKTTFKTGDTFSTEGMVITGKLSDGSTRNIPLSDEKLKFTGFDTNKRAVQTITVTYGVAKTTYDVTVLYKESQVKEIAAYFTLLGDSYHKEATADDGPHTLSKGNLQTWVSQTKVTINNNTTVYDVFKKVLNDNSITWKESSKLGTVYIESLTRNGVTLGEFDNGNLSGWMYTLNGTHPDLGVAQQFLEKGDRIVFHYTDDYTKEEGSDHWNTPGGVVEEVKDVTTDTKTGTTTAPTEVKVSEKTNADGTKTKVAEVKVSTDNQKEILKQAKASKSKEIILNVSSKSVGDAAKADVTLDKSFIDSIVKETDAKLTIKTPFGDKTYTQEELKAMSAAATGSTVTVAIEKAAEPPVDDTANAEKIEKAKSIVKDMKLVARSSKTAKKNVKAVLKSDAKVKASIKELKDLGFTVKYRFYRSTKKVAGYKAAVTKKTASYTNTGGKKGTKYFYKVQVRVYDENGKLTAKTALKQCKYASRTWTK